MTLVTDSWAEASAYERYIGRWSRLVADDFLAWLRAGRGLAWTDVGCGTGALGHAVLGQCAPRLLLALDRSYDFLVGARQRVRTAAGGVVVADAGMLPVADASVDVAVSALVLNFVPDPRQMVKEMARVVSPDGQVALYVWDYAGRMELLRYFWDAVAELEPRAAGLDEGVRFPICRPDPLRALFVDCGLQDVEVRAIDVDTRFRDFDDFWSPFLGGQGPAPGYVAGLAEQDRSELRERVSSRVPRALDGTIALVARAWAVRGRKHTG